MAPRLTPAQMHLQRQQERALRASVPALAASSGEPDGADDAPRNAGFVRGRNTSLASQVRDRKLAEIAAGLPVAANDNAAPAADPGEASERAALAAYDRLRMQLIEDRRLLKATQSVERKIELKRGFLPVYAPWVEGALAGDGAGEDEILQYVMIWSIDTGAYDLGLELVDHALRHGLGMPEHFRRDLATWAAEEIAEAATKAFNAAKSAEGAPFPHGVLGRVEQLVAGRDMHDEVRAKICKAVGLECAWLAENPPEGQAVAGWRSSQLEAALACYRRAIELDAGIGLKRAAELIERDLRKETTP